MAYTVSVLDMWDYPDDGAITVVAGFQTLELAREYARRRTWDSVEKQRQGAKSIEDLRQRWTIYGDSCSVDGDSYRAADELDYFIEHIATQEQRDWGALDPEKGPNAGD